MIGVIADPSEHWVVGEFFQLFKTPWEFYRSDRQYEVVLCAGDGTFSGKAPGLVLIYSGSELSFDVPHPVEVLAQRPTGRICSYRSFQIPVHGDVVAFDVTESVFLIDGESNRSVGYAQQSGRGTVARIGYDLFREIGTLLTAGQPSCNANIPALDIHIALLRDLIVASEVPLVEIPPVPAGYRFIACLTHDVDHPSIRQHRFDHTMFGFLYRAVVHSVFNVFRRRISVGQLVTNWLAAFRLPFVYLGIAKDFWRDFARYPFLEPGGRSSFFVIPFKGDPGRKSRGGLAPKRRASAYGASDITREIQALASMGCEIGLHGIDAWLDSSRCREELEAIRQIAATGQIGVRMHWLYFDKESPMILERAGADYDATVGFNETVGYRAGTTQVYKPLGVTRLLELPLHIMDTALFYPAHLNLSPGEASKLVSSIIDNAVRFGGVVTVNWHDRSILPERGWTAFYVNLIDELKNKGAWFATAAESVEWFRKRRAASFVSAGSALEMTYVTPDNVTGNLPALQLSSVNAQTAAVTPS